MLLLANNLILASCAQYNSKSIQLVLKSPGLGGCLIFTPIGTHTVTTADELSSWAQPFSEKRQKKEAILSKRQTTGLLCSRRAVHIKPHTYQNDAQPASSRMSVNSESGSKTFPHTEDSLVQWGTSFHMSHLLSSLLWDLLSPRESHLLSPNCRHSFLEQIAEHPLGDRI